MLALLCQDDTVYAGPDLLWDPKEKNSEKKTKIIYMPTTQLKPGIYLNDRRLAPKPLKICRIPGRTGKQFSAEYYYGTSCLSASHAWMCTKEQALQNSYDVQCHHYFLSKQTFRDMGFPDGTSECEALAVLSFGKITKRYDALCDTPCPPHRANPCFLYIGV